MRTIRIALKDLSSSTYSSDINKIINFFSTNFNILNIGTIRSAS